MWPKAVRLSDLCRALVWQIGTTEDGDAATDILRYCGVEDEPPHANNAQGQSPRESVCHLLLPPAANVSYAVGLSFVV